ncbi:MAG: hypothetical protein LW768_10255 [Rubrivivax sp.]|jgi:hypothetical protein|nr:hypothetical protein [Rubrivivax sp.]
MRRAVCLVILLAALPALADVVIRMRDGSVHRVPVDPKDVLGVEMEPGIGRVGPVLPPPSTMVAPTRLGTPWVVNSNGEIFRGDGRSWQTLSGRANDIAVGADGSAWVIGTNPQPGGYDIYRWNGREWSRVDGAGARIAVNARGEPWVVNANGLIYSRNGNRWREMPGRASDIGIGGGEVWIIGTNPQPGGYDIYRWSGSTWSRVAGAAVRIAVGPRGEPWVVNADGMIYRRVGNQWTEVPGRARDIAVSSTGVAWVIGIDPSPGGFFIYHWNGSAFQRVEGAAAQIGAQ